MGNGITFFTVPRSFEGEIGIIQTNAVKSWILLESEEWDYPRPEILFISDDPGVKEKAKELGCVHVPGVCHSVLGTPSVPDIFRLAQKRATHDLMCYINSDIVTLRGFMTALLRVARRMPRFLMIGQRQDFHYPKPLRFAPGWEDDLWEEAQKYGALHSPTGIDYFGFVRGLYKKIPPFWLGRRAWDNWLVWRVLRMDPPVPVVDATEVARVVHIGKTTTKPVTPEIQWNRNLADRAGSWGRVNFATWRLAPRHAYPGKLYRGGSE